MDSIDTIETVADNVSYFNWPIGNTIPSKTMSLYAVSKMVMLDDLEAATNKVRSGKWAKTDKLPYITPSGCFTKRKESEIVSYSGIVCLDLDNINTSGSTNLKPCNPETLKHILFADKFLNPAFIFVSPLGKGLKIFIRIRGSEASFHKDYFRVLSAYFNEQYGIPVDKSCRDLSRACLLCHDPEALFSPFGFVAHTDLLRKLPPEPPEPPAVISLLNSLYSRFYHTTDFTRYRSDKLNKCPAVHQLAVNCLLKQGWIQNGIYFCRPGKTNSRATNATFDIPQNYEIHIFYNFSSKALPFKAGKGYTDCMVISMLYFRNDYDRCISALYNKYYSLMRA